MSFFKTRKTNKTSKSHFRAMPQVWSSGFRSLIHLGVGGVGYDYCTGGPNCAGPWAAVALSLSAPPRLARDSLQHAECLLRTRLREGLSPLAAGGDEDTLQFFAFQETDRYSLRPALNHNKRFSAGAQPCAIS